MLITTGTVDPARVNAALAGPNLAFTTSCMHPDVLAALQAIGTPVETTEDVAFVTRSAAMRTDNPELVWSAFFNFNRTTIDRLIPLTWQRVSFDDVLATQNAVLDRVFRDALAPMAGDDLTELAALCRVTTLAAIQHAEGRPLCAGIAALPLPPKDDHMMVWHAGRLLREHRGDGHVATLLVEGLDRVEALVVHAAMLPQMRDGLRTSRRWRRPQWEDAIVDLRQKGWLTDDELPTFTPEGRERREWLERRTDELAAIAYEPIGNEGVERMITLGDQYRDALEAAGVGRGLLAGTPVDDAMRAER